MATEYDQIACGYSLTRHSDPRIAAMINHALGNVRTVVNVGAGTGSYEPAHMDVIAVEPSREMIRQRPIGSAPAVLACAEALPFRSNSFDAALAVLTIHHWRSIPAGLEELGRVAIHRLVILTCDPACENRFWLVSHYLPEIIDLDRGHLPTTGQLREWLGGIKVRDVPIPHDCKDGFLGAFWRKPEAYLEPAVRRGISAFAKLPPDRVGRAIGRLSDDLRSGRWDELFGHLRTQNSVDLGYRLIIATPCC